MGMFSLDECPDEMRPLPLTPEQEGVKKIKNVGFNEAIDEALKLVFTAIEKANNNVIRSSNTSDGEGLEWIKVRSQIRTLADKIQNLKR